MSKKASRFELRNQRMIRDDSLGKEEKARLLRRVISQALGVSVVTSQDVRFYLSRYEELKARGLVS